MAYIDSNIRVLDAAYKPFPPFGDWLASTSIDTARWNRYRKSLESRTEVSKEVLARAREIAKRAAAIDTGAIEGLYEVDRGFTYTAALAAKGESVRSLFEAQLHAYDYVLDLATRAEPPSEAAIRALHEEVCRAQDTYRVMTAIGPQEQPLPKGQYKALPNHVRTRKGTDHSYAPVDATPAETQRLVSELRSEAFLGAHPVIQASYAHYALVIIHPFADGNGRVARALASTFTYRAMSMPIVILSEQKDAYLDSLEGADGGDYQAFQDFMLARSLDTIQLIDESVRAALQPSAEESAAGLNSLYVTRGGYSHDQIDQAGQGILQAAAGILNETLSRFPIPKVTKNAGTAQMQYPIHDAAYRMPVVGNSGTGLGLTINVNSAAPVQASVLRHYGLWLPKDAARQDDILLVRTNPPPQPPDAFSARVDEVVPGIAGPLQIRLRLFAERVVAEMLSELGSLARRILNRA
jgi:Fic family protein